MLFFMKQYYACIAIICPSSGCLSKNTRGVNLQSLWLFLSLVLSTTFSSTIAYAQLSFSQETEQAGIIAPHEFAYLITGQSWGDFNNDDCPDLYITNSRGPNKLYVNNCHGGFSLATFNQSLALENTQSGGASFADYNNDGWRDLVVAANGANSLFQNINGTGFVDVTDNAGVSNADSRAETIVWADYDSDGYLDFYVVNYGNLGDLLSRDVLFHNNQDGTFTDVSSALTQLTRERSGFTARWLDYDNDGDADLYVVNDKFQGNPLWRNDGAGCGGWCFVDVSVSTGANRPVDGMGIGAGDYDNDGDLDLYFSSSGEAVLLQSQISQGQDLFTEVTDIAGVNFSAVSWGTHFLDIDNDGWQDLYLSIFHRENRIFHNQGNSTFVDVSANSNADDPGATIGSAVSDYDRDGALDIIIGNVDDSYVLYRNTTESAQANDWLRIQLIGNFDINRDAIGSKVYLTTDNGITQMQDIRSGNSIGAGSESVLHFGLGQHQINEVKSYGKTAIFKF